MKKDFNLFFTTQGQKFECWKTLITIVPTLISLIVLLIGISLIAYGQGTSFVPDIGIGLLTSSVVSLVFLFNDYLKKEIAYRNNRALFFEEFTLFLFDSLTSLPPLLHKNVNYGMQDYIVQQHRKFHDNYKKIMVNSQDNFITFELKRLALEIVNSNKIGFNEIFNSMSYRVEAGSFTKYELKLLSTYYSNFQAMVNTINEDNDVVIYHTAMWLTSNRRLLEVFSELKDMTTINMHFDMEGKCKADYSKYIQKESFVKFKLEFQEIRRNNYAKIYSKAKEKDIEVRINE